MTQTTPTPFTVEDLKVTMIECAGAAENVNLGDDISEVPFVDLGYDSLAVLEVTAKLQNHLGVVIPDDVVEQLPTPRALADYVNVRLAN
ncbi:acyl carrier protein [Nonomuraea sp. B19D2]|uniref:acyl carrier protein n=1 Tax=Nonomuraea sp. B19D2 TaxID=3159561 RepID=UPI0032DA4149